MVMRLSPHSYPLAVRCDIFFLESFICIPSQKIRWFCSCTTKKFDSCPSQSLSVPHRLRTAVPPPFPYRSAGTGERSGSSGPRWCARRPPCPCPSLPPRPRCRLPDPTPGAATPPCAEVPPPLRSHEEMPRWRPLGPTCHGPRVPPAPSPFGTPNPRR